MRNLTIAVLALVLMGELIYALVAGGDASGVTGKLVGPKEVGIALFGPYLIGAELAGMLLLAGLVGAFHIGRVERRTEVGEESAA